MPRHTKASGISDPLLAQSELAEYLRKPEGTLGHWRSRGQAGHRGRGGMTS